MQKRTIKEQVLFYGLTVAIAVSIGLAYSNGYMLFQ